MSEHKKKLHIDIETGSTDFGKPGQTFIAACSIDGGPVETVDFSQVAPTCLDNRWLTCPGSHQMTEEELNKKYPEK